jgi:hypothetical protein
MGTWGTKFKDNDTSQDIWGHFQSRIAAEAEVVINRLLTKKGISGKYDRGYKYSAYEILGFIDEMIDSGIGLSPNVSAMIPRLIKQYENEEFEDLGWRNPPAAKKALFAFTEKVRRLKPSSFSDRIGKIFASRK